MFNLFYPEPDKELVMDADNHKTFETEKYIVLELDNRNHAASVSFQSFIVHLAKADQLHLLQKLFNCSNKTTTYWLQQC